jgi:hypothetical protein
MMDFLRWAALIVGGGLIFSGFRAIRRRQARVPELRQGMRAVCLGWFWVGLGTLFVLSVPFDNSVLRTLFRLFLQAAN